MNEGNDGSRSQADSLIGLDIAHGFDPTSQMYSADMGQKHKQSRRSKQTVRISKESLS